MGHRLYAHALFVSVQIVKYMFTSNYKKPFVQGMPLLSLQDLPNDLLNYSLYMPPTGVGKLGKYLDDGRLLSDYTLQGHVPKLEVG